MKLHDSIFMSGCMCHELVIGLFALCDIVSIHYAGTCNSHVPVTCGSEES